MHIVIESRRKKLATIEKTYPHATIVDVTSRAPFPMVQLSPFYPHGGIPVPFSPGVTASCVEGVWQALKVFEHADVDEELLHNRTMKNLKRTVRRYGKPLGHRQGVRGERLLGYQEAKHQIYLPTYRWMLEHKGGALVEQLRQLAEHQTLVLLDYNTCEDVDDDKKPLSHAYLLKAYIEGLYPYDDSPQQVARKAPSAPMQRSLFDSEGEPSCPPEERPS